MNAPTLEPWQKAWAIACTKRDPLTFVTGVLGVGLHDPADPGKDNTLAAWQQEALTALRDGKARLSIRSGHGVGKALHAGEPVLTPSGWVPIGSIKIGDKVAAPDGKFSTVLGVYPQGVRDMFRVTLDDGCSVLADAEHLWLTQSRSERKHGKPGRVRSTAEIAKALTFPNGVRRGLNYSLPQIMAVEHPPAVLPVDPYVLGVILGDGDACGRISYGEDRAILPLMVAAGARFGRESQSQNRCPTSTVIGIKPALRAMGLFGCRAHQKFIPHGYLVGSVSQRIALLQGILDTDGTVGKNMAVVLDVTAPRLADDVSELVRSLGGVARRSEKMGKLNGIEKRRVYRVFISLPPDIAPFRLPSKAARYRPSFGSPNRNRTLQRFIRSIEPAGKGPAVCISVDHPSKLYVTRDHIVTHNTTFTAWIVLYALLCMGPDTKVPIAAGSRDQLRDTIQPEINKWHSRLPPALAAQIDVTVERITIKAAPEEAFAVFRTASKDNPQALAGFHAKNLWFLIDEASAVAEIAFEVAQGALSTPGAVAILTGNPTKAQGYFYDTHHKLRERWYTMRVSSEDVPRARGHIDDVIAAYGKSSNRYRVRVLGEFPTSDDEAVIPLELVLAARGRDVETSNVWPIWGCDVARFGDDTTALCMRQGNALLGLKEWHGLDGAQVAGRIQALYRETPNHLKPKEIVIDVIGVGASVYDILRLPGSECREAIRGCNVAERAAVSELDHNLRSELWFRGRAWFDERKCVIPTAFSDPADNKLIEKLVAELTAPTYDFSHLGRRIVESKQDLKKRGVPSPNIADAFLLSLAGGVYPKNSYHSNRDRQPQGSWMSA